MTAIVLIVTGVWKVDGVVKSDSAELYSMPLAGAAVVQQIDKGEELRLLGSSQDKESGQTYSKVWQEGNDQNLWVNVADINKVEGIAKTSMA